MFITHDLAVVRQVASSVVVLYRGRIVEEGPVDLILRQPLHPYTQRLIDSVPRPGRIPTRQLAIVTESEEGCLYRARCPIARAECEREPQLVEQAAGHQVRCWFPSLPASDVTVELRAALENVKNSPDMASTAGKEELE